MSPNRDMFGELRVTIAGNPTLANAANQIMQAVDNDASLLEGATVGEIDRKLRVAVWMDSGLGEILHASVYAYFIPLTLQDKVADWLKSQDCTDPELLRRARQWLVEHDHIRLPAQAIRDAERQRGRLTGSFRS